MKAGFYTFLLASLVTLSLLSIGSGISSPRDNGTTTRMSITSEGTQGNGDSTGASISSAGQPIAFNSNASNLVNGDTNDSQDVLIHQR